ncbi:hypothetical protein [Methylobacterium iners]|uniref:Uncharacterized protein n=1 Tax=Methylobacterium iners TaxID=418707 RepID=A0ABQ4RQC3_9HYPH|nr:hypothetical protein [Methylobacterium iners]GJD92956.1 hypothetical protein OCOJLMKI_0140 [Methylobacterium iners]
MGTIVPAPWNFGGSDQQKRAEARSEAHRAIAEAFHNRDELLELSSAAYRGPLELARRLQRSDHGVLSDSQDMTLHQWWGVLYGEGTVPEDPYPVSYCYEIQRIAPFVASLH